MKINPESELHLYRHKIIEVVKFHEVDLLAVCNNAVYFNYFEDARVKYLQHLKRNFNLKEIMEGTSFFIMAHNECDYIEPALFDETLIVHTRIEFIKRTSFGFRHLVQNKETNRIIAVGGGVLVHIDKETKAPLPLPQEFYNAVSEFEKEVAVLANDKD